jgi:hypothetical protein
VYAMKTMEKYKVQRAGAVSCPIPEKELMILSNYPCPPNVIYISPVARARADGSLA